MGVAEFLVIVQCPGKVFVHHGGHVAGVVGEHHAIDGHVLRVRGGTPVPRSRVVGVVIVLVHFSANVCRQKKPTAKRKNINKNRSVFRNEKKNFLNPSSSSSSSTVFVIRLIPRYRLNFVNDDNKK